MSERNVQNNDDLFRFIDKDTIESEKITAPRYSYWASVFRVFFRKKINYVLIFLFIMLFVGAFVVPAIYPYDPYENVTDAKTYNLPPSKAMDYFGDRSFRVEATFEGNVLTSLKVYEKATGSSEYAPSEYETSGNEAAFKSFFMKKDRTYPIDVESLDSKSVPGVYVSRVRAVANAINQAYQSTASAGGNQTYSAEAQDAGTPLKWILGTGKNGNSIFSGIMASARTSLMLACICAAINMTVGIILGAVWGYSKGFDQVMLVIYNILANVPEILMLSVLVYVIGSGFWSFIFALTVTGWLGIAYFFRTQVLIIRDREYSLASRCLGTPIPRMISKNILPFITSVIVTLLATQLPSYISSEVFLSYIGIGLSAEVPSLGRMIQEAQANFTTYPWEFWPPVSIAAAITIILYMLGQNLADATDPRTHM